jgi:hypothetical protein
MKVLKIVEISEDGSLHVHHCENLESHQVDDNQSYKNSILRS